MGEVSGRRLVCERLAKKSQAGASSLWGPQIILLFRAGNRPPVTAVTVGLHLLEDGGSLRREP
eukprot:7637137-Pyramimonas_sp.AAC.1